MKIGLSLSMCIKDIIKGVVRETDVAALVTNTCARCHTDWLGLYHQYAASYWSANSKKAFLIVDRLREQEKIVQPRIYDPKYQHSSNPHWIDLTAQRLGMCDPRTDDVATRSQTGWTGSKPAVETLDANILRRIAHLEQIMKVDQGKVA